MTHFIYNQLMRVLLPFMLLRLKRKSRKQPEYGVRWDERLARKKITVKSGGVLFHVASLGEAIAATPIISAFIQQNPNTTVTVTSTTPTGSQQIKQTFSEHTQVTHCYLPFDLPIIQRRFIDQIKPSVLVLMETELWPNLIHHAKRINCRVMVINARMSERSAKGYRKFAKLTFNMMQKLDLVAAQFDTDAKRFLQLGCRPDRIKITGNIKFDTRLSPSEQQNISQFVQNWQLQQPVWLAASTHPGEETQILQTHKSLVKKFPDLLLIIVPRHPDRFAQVYDECRTYFATERKTQIADKPNANTQVIVGDTLGEMAYYIALANMVFVGGSLVERGGHNPFESACQEKAILHGPHVFNFEKSYQILAEYQGCTKVNDKLGLQTQLAYLITNKSARLALAYQAKSCQQAFQGASEHTVQLINTQLNIAHKAALRREQFTTSKRRVYN
ncbi:lipid IV(A) 3-deoxy-D-manno-octulosonic acid transferase [Catenovulum sediminis]|uniref:3-deoxy-D-manno-octulosonic acid transferase n=1 Tax=Catenovulum sediminis TaxID=1740262 RepID=A0ABV1RGI9_9ALTE|nr:lipid IV(A) 3-deoxy-D-manno-octulosonic acid transferase [Catenovulum sediminis]